MKTRWLRLLLLPLLALVVDRAGAGEPYWQFLEGLRQRRYYDYALLYLDQLAADSSVPTEVRDVLPYERAVTLLQSAQTLRSPQAQAQQLDEALKLFDQFVQAHPNHPKVAEANSQRARVLFDKGRVRVWQIQSTSDESDRQSLQEEARALFEQARRILRDAQERYDAALKKFPTYIDERTQADLYEQRKKVEAALVSTKLRLALSTYYEAQTYDPGSQSFRRLLAEACDQLGKIYEPYRTQVGGLYARLWQAKCFEEQGDVRRALGIYKDLLNHPGRSPQMQRLKDQAFHFRLICLNHEKRKDYALAVQQAQEWLKTRRGAASRTSEALAVRWQLALAQERLARQRTRKPKERERLLQAAIDQLRLVSKYPGEFQDRAKAKLREL
ncbi:MAG TPA: hypothetical protein EYP14_15865, partial [Planctomycetaceae bacterium]|nr:hypothetical protein [Planctomycetaceae bacterium]